MEIMSLIIWVEKTGHMILLRTHEVAYLRLWYYGRFRSLAISCLIHCVLPFGNVSSQPEIMLLYFLTHEYPIVCRSIKKNCPKNIKIQKLS